MTSERITRADIDEVKRRHILQNLLYTPVEASQLLAISVRQVFVLVEEQKLIAANEGKARNGKATRGTRITAESLEIYRRSITVTPDSWAE